MLCVFGLIISIIVAILDHIGMKKLGLADVIQKESNNMVWIFFVVVVALCIDLF